MELGRPGCPVDRLLNSPRHERGTARCLLGTGANPKVWCDWLWGLCEGSCHGLFPVCRGGMSAHRNVSCGCVLWVQLYTSDQSKTIRIAVPAVMGGRPDSP